jgi:hypothetical protein
LTETASKEIIKKPKKQKHGNGHDPDFEAFWGAYPNHRPGKTATLEKWEQARKRGRLPPIETILTAIEEQKTWEQWQKDGGQFIPHATTWLNQAQWEAEKPKAEDSIDQWMRQHSRSP